MPGESRPGADVSPPSTPAIESTAGPAHSHRAGFWPRLRHLLAQAIRLGLRRRAIGCLGIALLAVLVIGAGLLALRALSPEPDSLAQLEQVPVNDAGTVVNEQVEGVEQYIAGMMAFDAQPMWESYAESVRTELQSRGQSMSQLQDGLDSARAQGAAIDGVRQVGTFPLRDGRRYVFYIVARHGFPPNGGDEELYFIFTVDPFGKVLNVT